MQLLVFGFRVGGGVQVIYGHKAYILFAHACFYKKFDGKPKD